MQSLLALNGTAPPCRSEPFADPYAKNVSTYSDEPIEQTVVNGFRRPLHVDVTKLSDNDAVRHVLGLYDGSSVLVDAKKKVNTPLAEFSRVGGILSGKPSQS